MIDPFACAPEASLGCACRYLFLGFNNVIEVRCEENYKYIKEVTD